jgi:ribonucleotide reductase alpha subunit
MIKYKNKLCIENGIDYHFKNKMQRKVPDYLCKRYDFDGNKETLYERVVKHILPPYRDYKEYVSIMVQDKFVPAGNTLMAGSGRLLSPNCIVIGSITNDNREEKRNLFIQLLKRCIGVGIDLSFVDDPVDVLKDFSYCAKNEVTLSWDRPLRGCIATLSVRHPKIMDFIQCKDTQEKANNIAMFNISVSIDDGFMIDIDHNDYYNNVYRELCIACHKTGDPGIIFSNRVQSDDRYTKILGNIVTLSPCGELHMHDYETCNLGSINLSAFYDKSSNTFNYDDYRHTIKLAIEFLNSVIDKLDLDDKELPSIIKERTLYCRRIGLGVMGLSTLLRDMNIPYGSYENIAMSSNLASILKQASREAAKTYGNISLTCIAPTGGIRALIDDDGYGIEPFFNEATLITPLFHLSILSTWQEHIDNAISKTVNIKNDATVDDVMMIYDQAFKLKCKGVTVYRDGCRDYQPKECSTCLL